MERALLLVAFLILVQENKNVSDSKRLRHLFYCNVKTLFFDNTNLIKTFCFSPESVKTRSDVFYLQPERSCVPDSPVWYSTTALSKEPLEKMLNRVKMVKEINIALLMT